GLRRPHAVPRQDVLHHGALVGGVLVHLDDAELSRAALDDLGMTARDDGRDHTGVAEQHEPLAIAHIEALELVAAVGVPDAAGGEHAVNVQGDEPHCAEPGRRHSRHAPRSASSRSMTKGSAIAARATSSTSVSPKLYSNRPLTRNAATAARTPTTSVRSAVPVAGRWRRMPPARTKNVTKIHSHSPSPTSPRSVAICSGVLCRWPV